MNRSNKNIAIIGAGFTGLATAWHLLHRAPQLQITLFDSIGIGGGASGVSAGLMHPYAGAHAKLNWLGVEGMESSLNLINESEKAIGRSVADRQGLLRLALSNSQLSDFKNCSEKYSNVIWQTREQCLLHHPCLAEHPGIFIDSAVTVKSDLYMQGLWRACQKLGNIDLVISKITTLSELKNFDQIVVATGAYIKEIEELTKTAVTQVKGQVLILEWPKNIPKIEMSVNSQAYLVMNDDKSCLVGATFEKNFDTHAPILELAVADLMPKVLAVMPALEKAKILTCRAGLRASTPDHKPLKMRVNDKCWILTGMGSKGLLYHSLFAEKLAHEMLSECIL
jgi:glycine/D-amino acid oxidase-like deaminating enzyme